VVNDIDYYYMVQALGTNDACFGPVSNCAIVTRCRASRPTADRPDAGRGRRQPDQPDLISSDPIADSFSVYRAVGSCPQPSYELIASGVTTLSYLDTTASGGLAYPTWYGQDVTGAASPRRATALRLRPPARASSPRLRRPAVGDQCRA